MYRPRVVIAILSFALAVAGCDSSSGDVDSGGVDFGGPSAGGTVTTFRFPIQVTIDPNIYDGNSLRLILNGELLPLSGGPATYSTIVEPGPPLRDDNALEVEVTPRSGSNPVRSTKTFRYLPPKARAHRITGDGQLIRGPLAHGRIGDFLLENTEARYIMQDVAKRDLYSVGTFGGNIIDAELVSRPGTDNFLEIQPAINIETVINAQTLEVVNDGQDGTAAIIRTCGPDDIIDFINPSVLIESAGLAFPASADDADHDVEGCTDYVLEPEKRYVELTTTVFNNESVERGFYVGDYINGSGELDQFTTLGAGVGEILTNRLSAMSYIGIGEANGVDYALVLLPDGPADRSSFFTTSGVSYVMHNQTVVSIVTTGQPPQFAVPANGRRSFTRYFGVGDGSMGNAIDIQNEVTGELTGTLRGCVTTAGLPLAEARVSVGRGPEGEIRQLSSQFVTDASGCFSGTLVAGNYGVAAARRGFPYEGSGATPIVHPIVVTEGATTVQDIALPATARVRVTVTDEQNRGIPARISVVGFDPSPEVPLIVSSVVGSTATGLFYDFGKDPLPFGFAALEYAGPDGVAEFDIEPGRYQLYASRGTEYSLASVEVVATAGPTQQHTLQIARVIDSEGFVSSDFHVHGIASADSRVSQRNRVYQFAGEGIDNVVMTDHEANTDLNPRIAALGFDRFLRATIGEEITTGDYGHFNAYPLRIDPTRPSGGSIDWAVGAAPGRDFPSLGSYSLTPDRIAQLATTGSASQPTTTIQINHIDSHFRPLKIDTSLVPPRSALTAEEKIRLRLDPASGNLFHHFPALETWNGASRGSQREFLDLRLGIWFNHLNQGLRTTAIGDTDTHEFTNLGVAGARTWTASPTDDPARIDPADVATAISGGRAIAGQGPFVEARLLAEDGSNRVADLRHGGSTMVRTDNRRVSLDIRVQSPLWAAFDTIEVYANAPTTVTQLEGDVPVLFTSSPSLTFRAGTDFEVRRIPVAAGVAGAERYEASLVLPFDDLVEDTWFVVMAKGSEGTSAPMFPVMPTNLSTASNTNLDELIDGNLGEGGVLALGHTNALYADVDGEAGFQPPRQ